MLVATAVCAVFGYTPNVFIIIYILIALYVINCIALLIVTMMQNKDNSGASGTIVGSSTNSFYEKNKGKTHEGRIKRWTIILGILFLVLTIVLGIVFMM